jgi:hypothetical protein
MTTNAPREDTSSHARSVDAPRPLNGTASHKCYSSLSAAPDGYPGESGRAERPVFGDIELHCRESSNVRNSTESTPATAPFTQPDHISVWSYQPSDMDNVDRVTRTAHLRRLCYLASIHVRALINGMGTA